MSRVVQHSQNLRVWIQLAFLAILLDSVGRAQVTFDGLEFDAGARTQFVRHGETNALFTFAVTNKSQKEVVITDVQTSCGCTVAKLAPLPWTLAPQTGGLITFNMDLAGKEGGVHKSGYIFTAAGMFTLNIHAELPPDPTGNRTMNQALAAQNRQVVFQGDCAACHATPTVGKTGKALFEAACAICHASENRASFMPVLQSFLPTASADFWRSRIADGEEKTLMPAFSKAKGGPLDDAQIQSLVDYLTGDFKNEPEIGRAHV